MCGLAAISQKLRHKSTDPVFSVIFAVLHDIWRKQICGPWVAKSSGAMPSAQKLQVGLNTKCIFINE